MPDVCPIGTEIQTVLVPHSKFPTRGSARAWIVEHGFKATKMDEGKTVTRFRQIEPDHFEPKSFRTIPLGSSGVQAVIGCPRQHEPERKSASGPKSAPGRKSASERKSAPRRKSAVRSESLAGDRELRERVKSLVGKRK